MKKKFFLKNSYVLIAVFILVLYNNLFSQVVIKDTVEINPVEQLNPDRQQGGMWFMGCYYDLYDSTELEVRFIPEEIEPGESTIIELWRISGGNEYLYNEETDSVIQKIINVEPNYGELIYSGEGKYKFIASDTISVDSVVATINYENYNIGCAVFDYPIINTVRGNCLDCTPYNGLPDLSRMFGSGQITIKRDSLDVTITPSEIFAGDTAEVIIKKRLPNGTLIDFDTTQTFEVGMLEGCILGKIHTGAVDTNYIYGATQPIYFVADTSIADSGEVLLRVGLIEETLKDDKQNDNPESYCFIGSYVSTTFDDANASVENPLKIISPTSLTIKEISEEPQMPIINCSAVYLKFYPEVIKYEWKFIVTKHYERRTTSLSPICERISRSEFQGISYSDYGGLLTQWTVPFDKDSGYFYFKAISHRNQNKPGYGCSEELNYWYDETSDEIFTGGEVLITLTAKNYQTGEVLAKVEEIPSGKIRGVNPDDTDVNSYLNDNVVRALKDFESLNYQFEYNANKSWPYNETGWPIYGEPNGYGLMQLDDPTPTERQLWNWKANIDGGKAWFYALKAQSDGFLNQHPTNVTDEMRLKCVYQSYNYSGLQKHHELVFYYIWDRKKWIPDERVPKSPRNGGQKKYGDWVYEKYLQLN